MTPRRIAGVDEVGRGPLAGPVVACAVVFSPEFCEPMWSGVASHLADSKKLSAKRRGDLRRGLLAAARAGTIEWALGWATSGEIDALNIQAATWLAMTRALDTLDVPPDFVRVDGCFVPPRWRDRGEAIVGGDGRIAEISAASILAKEARDCWMRTLAQWYPAYGFERHAGYPTAAHRAALEEFGASPVHRRSFAPVARAVAMGRGGPGADGLSEQKSSVRGVVQG
ncbi:MAG: ribonuclease HII [Thioalkalivibrionaceae bacterium]